MAFKVRPPCSGILPCATRQPGQIQLLVMKILKMFNNTFPLLVPALPYHA